MRPNKRLKKHNITEEKYFTFEDLKFYPHRNGLGGVQAIMEFDNGHRISVVGGSFGLYGNGTDTFEIWRSYDSDVKGYLSKEEVTEEMIDLQKLNSNVPRNELGF